MNLTEVKKTLERQFDRELTQGSKRNIVFWYDEEGVFADSIDTLALDNVKLIKLYDNKLIPKGQGKPAHVYRRSRRHGYLFLRRRK